MLKSLKSEFELLRCCQYFALLSDKAKTSLLKDFVQVLGILKLVDFHVYTH